MELTEDKYLSSAGFILTGLLMFSLFLFMVIPDSFSLENMNVLRLVGGISLVVIGVAIMHYEKNGLVAAAMILNGAMYVMAAEVSLTSTSDPLMIMFALGYLLITIMFVIGKESHYLMAATMILSMFNLIFRYVLDLDIGKTVGGVFCLLSAIVAFYVGMSLISYRVKLPMY